MSLVESYLMNNGYDYFDNAAEDTLVFFVRDEDAPYAQPRENDTDEEISNSFDDSLKGATGTMPTADDNSNDDDGSGSVPHLTPVDAEQTEAQKSSLKN